MKWPTNSETSIDTPAPGDGIRNEKKRLLHEKDRRRDPAIRIFQASLRQPGDPHYGPLALRPQVSLGLLLSESWKELLHCESVAMLLPWTFLHFSHKTPVMFLFFCKKYNQNGLCESVGLVSAISDGQNCPASSECSDLPESSS